MKVKRPITAVAIAVILGVRALIGTVGDSSTANDILAFLSPKARAFVTADATWTVLAIVSFLWLAFELSRDAGVATQALIDAKGANERAWKFEPEFRDFAERFKLLVNENDQQKKDLIETRSAVEALTADVRLCEGALKNSLYMDALHWNKRRIEEQITRISKAPAGYFGMQLGPGAMQEREFARVALGASDTIVDVARLLSFKMTDIDHFAGIRRADQMGHTEQENLVIQKMPDGAKNSYLSIDAKLRSVLEMINVAERDTIMPRLRS